MRGSRLWLPGEVFHDFVFVNIYKLEFSSDFIVCGV